MTAQVFVLCWEARKNTQRESEVQRPLRLTTPQHAHENEYDSRYTRERESRVRAVLRLPSGGSCVALAANHQGWRGGGPPRPHAQHISRSSIRGDANAVVTTPACMQPLRTRGRWPLRCRVLRDVDMCTPQSDLQDRTQRPTSLASPITTALSTPISYRPLCVRSRPRPATTPRRTSQGLHGPPAVVPPRCRPPRRALPAPRGD